MPRKITISKKTLKTKKLVLKLQRNTTKTVVPVVPVVPVGLASPVLASTSTPVPALALASSGSSSNSVKIKLSRRYLNGYYYWVDSEGIIYDDEENEFARMGYIEQTGEFCWD